MKIEKHILTGTNVTQQATPNISGKFPAGMPDTIVIHFTGGRSAQSSANWLCNPEAKASAHLIIGKKGEVIQLAPFDTITWHAGRSSWQDRSGLNAYSIGIEIDNAGQLEQREEGYYTWFGTQVPNTQVTKAIHRNETEPAYWQAYTEEQINTTQELCTLLMEYTTINWILGHEEISPGRKVDPGPAFPLNKLRNQLLYSDREQDNTIVFDDLANSNNETQGYVTADLLNIRSAPNGTAAKVAPPLKKGTLVKVLEESSGWNKVVVETEGWVSGEWIRN